MYLTEIWRHINSLKHYHHNRRRRHCLHHPNHCIKLALLRSSHFGNCHFLFCFLLLHDWSVFCTLRDKAKCISRFRLAKTFFRILLPNMSFLALIIQTVHERSVVCVITNRTSSTRSIKVGSSFYFFLYSFF